MRVRQKSIILQIADMSLQQHFDKFAFKFNEQKVTVNISVSNVQKSYPSEKVTKRVKVILRHICSLL